MKLAIAQIETDAGDFEKTRGRMVEFARRAAEQGADLVAYPLCVLTGVGRVSAGDAIAYASDLSSVMGDLAAELPLPALVPIAINQDEGAYLDAVLIQDGDIKASRLDACAHAAVLGNSVEVSAEPPVIELAGQRIALAFTYDELDYLKDKGCDADTVIFFSSYGYAADDAGSSMACALETSSFVQDAEDLDAWFVGVGSLGCYNMQVFCGSSFVLTPWGELSCQAPAFEEALLTCDIDPAAEGPLASPQSFQVADAPLVMWEAVTYGLSCLVRLAGAAGVALVVDESLESQIMAAVATDALGPTRVFAYLDAAQEKNLAATSVALVNNLRLSCSFVEVPAGAGEKAARAALLSRAATEADERGLLPVSSRDKTTLALEGCPTLEAGFAMPLADVYKSDVLMLGHLRNTISPVIPYESRNAWRLPSVAGLEACGTTDEARLNFADAVIRGFVEWQRSLTDLARGEGHPEAVKAIVDLARRNATYMRCRPFGLAMSSRTLKEAQAAVGNVWQDEVRPDGEVFDIEAVAQAVQEILEQGAGDVADEAADGDVLESPQVQSDIQEILGYLKDFALGQGLDGEKVEGPRDDAGEADGGHPGFFGGPFSEN